MKFFCALVVLCLFLAFAAGDWAEIKTRLHAARDKCNMDASTRISDDTYEKIKKGEKPGNDENGAAFAMCMGKNMGWMTGEGKLNREVYTERIRNAIPDEEKRRTFMEKCAVDKDTPTETAINLLRCLMRGRRENMIP